MSTPAVVRLQRILDLEERQNWRNRSVIGGMRAMAARWAQDARNEEGADQRAVDALVALMERYDAASPEERAQIAGQMRAVIAGEVDLSVPPPAVPTEPEQTLIAGAAPESPPSPARERKPSGREPAERSEKRPAPRPEPANKPPQTAPAVSEPPREDGQEAAPLEIPLGDDGPAGSPSDQPHQNDPLATGDASQLPVRTEVVPGLGKVYEADPDDDYGAPPEPDHLARARQRRAQANERRNPRDLQSNVTILAGVGDATAEQLERLGISKVIDLLWHFPARYDDFSAMRTINMLQPGEQATVIANVWEVRERKISMSRTIVEGLLGDSTGTLHAVWFNKWVAKQLKPNTTLRFSGMVGLFRGRKSLENPQFEELDEERVATGRLSPVYPLTEGLSHNRLRNLIHDVLDGYARFLNDPLPAMIRHSYGLVDLPLALQQIHFPDSHEQLDQARRRLGFEELFYIQLGVLQRRRTLQQVTAPALTVDETLLARYTELLPFAFTAAQARVTDEVLRDLQRNVPMTRLVQGDVGSGKTAVAAAAMWAAAANNTQSAMLAPTQILAEQHHRGVGKLLSQLTRPDGQPVNVALLTGRVTGEERERVLQGLREGSVDVVVGTTALIQDTVEFANLGLAIVDEQHRFGVEQRGVLRTKSTDQPHLLVMSATPIPRSLALTIYGDLDISTIDEMPPGRTPITTRLFGATDRERLYNFIRREVADGRQAYIVYPLVEESETLDVGAATAEHKRLQEAVFPELKVALLHGRMTGTEKDAVMSAFSAGEYHLLVSTTVIEVGIDVPNATVMVIEDADRFGLAQLHQLRGRVGRGQHAGYCALLTKAENPLVRERLLLLADDEHGRDGFWIAQKDLELRGPGEFLGTRQSGLPGLRVAQLSDVTTIVQAREAAQMLFEQDPMLTQVPQLQRQVERFWRGHGDVS